MRHLSILLYAVLCSSCSLQTFDIQKAPLKTNQAVVFDIDGTLTPRVIAISTAREDAASAVLSFANNGYKIIYLSARPRLLQSGIPGWLTENHFPEGSIQVPQSAADSRDHRAFKKRILKAFMKNGWNFLAAYGDSTTDFEAYSAVGIDKEHVFALRRAGDDSCQPGRWAKCLNSWAEHMGDIEQMVQP